MEETDSAVGFVWRFFGEMGGHRPRNCLDV